jgi:hypothetical protein
MTNPAAPPPETGPDHGLVPVSADPVDGTPLAAGPGAQRSASDAPVAPPPQDEALSRELRVRRRDKILGLTIVGVTFLVSLALSIWAKHASRPETSAPPGPPTTVGVAGYPYRVDVVGTLAAARAATKRSLLRGIITDGVRSDGSIDVSEGPGRARYVFQSAPGRGPQPPAAGPGARGIYCGRQEVHLRSEGLVAVPDQASVPCPGRVIEPLPDPQCSLATIWQHALKKGIPGDRLARIEYFRANGGPAWRFDVRDGGKRFVLYGDCRRELKGSAATSQAP